MKLYIKCVYIIRTGGYEFRDYFNKINIFVDILQ